MPRSRLTYSRRSFVDRARQSFSQEISTAAIRPSDVGCSTAHEHRQTQSQSVVLCSRAKVDVFNLAGAIDVSLAPFEICQCRKRDPVPR